MRPPAEIGVIHHGERATEGERDREMHTGERDIGRAGEIERETKRKRERKKYGEKEMEGIDYI